MLAHRYVCAAAAALLLSVAVSSGPAAAQTRTPPEATQHALDELANAMAQGKITRTPTPSATATPSPMPRPSPQPTPEPPADTPVPTTIATPVPDPSLPVPDIGQLSSGYVRASPGDPDGAWLEVAVPQGRWAILYDTSLCAPPSAWTNVWLARDEQSDRPITVDRDDAAMCALAQWSWTSDVPCATDDQGTCDVERDDAYWDAIAQIEPTATDTSIPSPVPTETDTPMASEPAATDVPIPIPTPAPRPPMVPPTPLPSPRSPAPPTPLPSPPTVPLAAPAPPAPVAPPHELVVLTVVVFVTPWPTVTPTATWTATATPTAPPTSTPSPVRTGTEAASLVASASATEAPAVLVESAETSPAQSAWNWPLTIVILAVALGFVAIWLFVVRGGPVMW